MTSLPSLVCFAVVLVQVSRSSNQSPIGRIRNPSVPREYCEFETFQPSCWRNEVIIMRSALYGRMRIGRCVEDYLGFLGCSADVLQAADRKCSGRQNCTVAIPDVEFDSAKPCNKELKMYLEASYTCQKVAEDDRGCSVSVASGPHPVSLPSVSKFGCGTKSQPWIVEVVEGQRLNVTLIDFFRDRETSEPAGRVEGAKTTRGVLVDQVARKNVTVQSHSGERERWIYHSTGNVLEVYFTAKDQTPHGKSDGQNEFLLRIQAVGCADLRPSSDAWIKREGNELTVGCHSTQQTWHLQCQGHRWSGVIGNCTSNQMTAKKEALVNSESSALPHALAFATVAGVALALCLSIICIGVFVLRRFAKQDRLRDLAKAALQYDNVDSDDEVVQAYYTRTKVERCRSTAAPGAATDPSAYSHVWELPLPEPAGADEVTSSGVESAPIEGAGVMPTSPGDKKDTTVNNSGAVTARSDESRYFVLDRSAAAGQNNVSGCTNSASGGANPAAGANPGAITSSRC